jgi:hypothetical protein
MKLSDAIYYVSLFGKERQIDRKSKEALELILEVLQDNVNVEEWDYEYDHDTPMCIHCSGNGCASCRSTGDAQSFGNSEQFKNK